MDDGGDVTSLLYPEIVYLRIGHQNTIGFCQ